MMMAKLSMLVILENDGDAAAAPDCCHSYSSSCALFILKYHRKAQGNKSKMQVHFPLHIIFTRSLQKKNVLSIFDCATHFQMFWDGRDSQVFTPSIARWPGGKNFGCGWRARTRRDRGEINEILESLPKKKKVRYMDTHMATPPSQETQN